ncbi:MAG: hypothetical protein HYV13_03340 [Candidatus Doudnabacteria bacterium]|nr:hypothetical protein [Candidatus Doudnabacteria bacterium]
MDEIFDPNQREELNEHITEQHPLRDFVRNNKIIVGAVAAALLAVTAALVILLSQKEDITPVSNNVFLNIKGPSQINSGNEAEYRIIYRNGENSDLVSASLEVFYPSGAKFKSAAPAPISSSGSRFNLPKILAGADGEVKVRVQISGATAEDKLIAAKLNYKLADFNSEFEVKTEAHTLILAPNLTLEITGPIEVTNGQETTFGISFGNVSTQDFENLTLSVQYPEGLEFINSNPKPSKDKNIFIIPRLPIGGSGQIEITGVFSNESQEKLVIAELAQSINGQLAPLLSTSAAFRVVPAAMYLKITSQPQDVIELGDSIDFNLQYGNQSNIGMTNVVITVNFESTILDLTRMNVYDAIVAGNTITWKSATLSNLSVLGPNQKGEISFSAPIKSNLTSNVKNLTVKTMGTIRSDQMPKAAYASGLEIKLASSVNLLISGKYISGATPMKVGQPTTFAVNMLVINTSNDLVNTELTASLLLPPSAWNGVIIPESEKSNITHDPNSGRIRWKVGSLPAFTGKYTPARSAAFQLTVTPTESDRGRAMKLLSNIFVEGQDSFTNLLVKSQVVSELSTDNLDDEDFEQKGTSVQ